MIGKEIYDCPAAPGNWALNGLSTLLPTSIARVVGQIIWAMISREYLGILILFCTASGVLYIHKIDFQRKTLRLPHPSPFSPFFVPSTPLRSFPKLLFHKSPLSVSSSYTVILILRKPPLCSYTRPFPNYHSVTLIRFNSQLTLVPNL